LGDQAWRVGFPPSKRHVFVFERFHINHRFSYDHDEAFIEGLEIWLTELGATCILLTVSPEYVGERLAFRVRESGHVVDAKDIDEKAGRWISEQDHLIEEANKSNLPTILLNTDAMEWDSYAAQILTSTEVARDL